MTNIHFEELWERCEQFHQQASPDNSMEAIIEELLMKINLYKMIDLKTEMPEEDRQKAKSRTLGEILMTLTQVSLKDNINVFEALGVALQYHNIGFFNKKY